jgi:hypothetical protein
MQSIRIIAEADRRLGVAISNDWQRERDFARRPSGANADPSARQPRAFGPSTQHPACLLSAASASCDTFPEQLYGR